MADFNNYCEGESLLDKVIRWRRSCTPAVTSRELKFKSLSSVGVLRMIIGKFRVARIFVSRALYNRARMLPSCGNVRTCAEKLRKAANNAQN